MHSWGYDNALDYKTIKPFLPKTGGHVLLTTRNRQWPTKISVIDVNVMTKKDAVEAIIRLSGRKLEKETSKIERLANILGYLPLAIAQASSYIKQNNITFSKYSNLYDKYKLELLEDNPFTTNIDHSPASITWNISFDTIAKESSVNNRVPIAIELLVVCSYLSPDSISRKLLLKWIQYAHPELKESENLVLNEHISLMWKYSMINYNDDKSISIHRLVQAVLQKQLEQSMINSNNAYSILSLEWFELLLKFFTKNEDDFKFTNSLQQLLHTSNQFKAKFNGKHNKSLAELDLMIAEIYFMKENYKKFIKILDTVNKYLRNNNKPELFKLRSKSLYLYSAYYRKNGDFLAAKEKLHEALDTIDKIKLREYTKNYEIRMLKAKILFNMANITFAKSKKQDFEVTKKEIKDSINIAKNAISIFKEENNTLYWIRSIELFGRLQNLDNPYDTIVEFNKHTEFIDNLYNERTKMLFYLTYCDAYFLEKDYSNAMQYCNKAKFIANKLELKKEIENINNKTSNITSIMQRN